MPRRSLLDLISSVVLLLALSAGTYGGDPRGETAKADAPTTKPALTSLEIQLVFPGSLSQGRMEARVEPPSGCVLANLRASDGTRIAALYGRSTDNAAPGPSPTLLFFYGNGTCMAESLSVFNQLRRLGFNVITADYEGYGMSDGTPTEQGCYDTADAAYAYLLTRKEVDKRKIVASGWSLGAGVAIDLASRKHLAGLATFCAFTRVSEMARALAPAGQESPLLLSRFDNLAKIGSIECPIFMAVGTDDELIPAAMLDELAKASKSKLTIVRVGNATHNNIFRQGGDSLYQKVRQFVSDLPEGQPATNPK